MSDQIFETLGISSSLVILILVLLFLILFITVLILLSKVNFLMKRYDLFMRGKDCETMEDNIVEIYKKLQMMQKRDMANRDILKMMNRNMVNTIQKTALVKYNAFDGMGGQSSFALALLDLENSGVILNAMHSRNSCYLYVKEIKNGEPDMPLSKEEKMALDQSLKERKEKALSTGTKTKKQEKRIQNKNA